MASCQERPQSCHLRELKGRRREPEERITLEGLLLCSELGGVKMNPGLSVIM